MGAYVDLEQFWEPEFLDDLDTRAYGKERWLLTSELRYVTFVRGYPALIRVPPLFISDLSSIPRFARTLLPVNDYHRWAGVLHDWLFSSQDLHGYTRKEVDCIFDEAMDVTPLENWKRASMYRAVRIGAGGVWRRNLSAHGGMPSNRALVGLHSIPTGRYRF